MRKFKNENGFTLTEVAVFLSLIVIIAFFSVIGCGGSSTMAAAREAEVKANIHQIQIALERYMTDQNEYPAYLLGGDKQGWDDWHEKYGSVNTLIMSENRAASNALVRDPLIVGGYLNSYPNNPFVDNPRDIIKRTSLSGSDSIGDGDPRFGSVGRKMGMGLDDMNVFRGATHPGPFFWSRIETRRTLDRGNWGYIPAGINDSHPYDTDMYYLFGGMRDPEDIEIIVRTWWPGNFFYKGTSDQKFGSGNMIPVPNTHIGGHYNRYIIGGYGAKTTMGIDVIRLDYFDQNGNRLSWRCPENFGSNCFDLGYELFRGQFGDAGGLPEVFGGGDETHGPQNPYDRGSDDPNDFVYGAPDGTYDGVIIVLTNGSDTATEYIMPAEDDEEEQSEE